MKKLCIGLFVILCLFSCTKKESGKVLATIDKDNITMEEFTNELDKIPMNMKMAVATESGKKSFLDNLIIKKILLKESIKNKIEDDKEFQTRLSDIKTQLLIESLLKKKISSDSQLSDTEIKKYYDDNKEKFKKEREINTRHILLKTEEEARQMKEKLQNGEDFVELARKFSIDPTAKTTAGEIGFHPKGTLVPEYEDAAFKLAKVGQVSSIVKSQFGYHIIRLEGAKPPTYVSLDEVKDFIKQQLGQDKQKELVQKYIEDLKKNAKITINENLLKEEKPVASENTESKDNAGKEATSDKTKEQEKNNKPPAQEK